MPTPQPRPPAAGPSRPGQDRRKITTRKVTGPGRDLAEAGDSLTAWTQRYLDLAVRCVRSDEVTGKIDRHLGRFTTWLATGLARDRVCAGTPREVAAWQDHLAAEGTTGRDGTAA